MMGLTSYRSCGQYDGSVCDGDKAMTDDELKAATDDELVGKMAEAISQEPPGCWNMGDVPKARKALAIAKPEIDRQLVLLRGP